MEEFERVAKAAVNAAVDNDENGFDFGVFKAYLALGIMDCFDTTIKMLGASVADGKQSYTIVVESRNYGLRTVYVHLAGSNVLGVSVF